MAPLHTGLGVQYSYLKGMWARAHVWLLL